METDYIEINFLSSETDSFQILMQTCNLIFFPVLLQCFQSLPVSVFLVQIWLTDIGAHLQLKLKGVPQKDPTFEGKPAGLYKVKTTVITVSKSLILCFNEH